MPSCSAWSATKRFCGQVRDSLLGALRGDAVDDEVSEQNCSNVMTRATTGAPSTVEGGTSVGRSQVITVVKGNSGKRYKILEVIGKGGFGMVHRGTLDIEEPLESGFPRVEQFAIKAEQESSIHLEIEVLTATRGKIHFCQLLDSGFDDYCNVHYIVMNLLGPNLVQARNCICRRSFSLSTAIRIGIQTLHAIEELHSVGFLSRDVKPSNFALGRFSSEQRCRVFMLDFGIARRYVDDGGDPLPQRDSGGWRGTSRYCSLRVHQKLDQSRRDDLESWFYMMVELLGGRLLWVYLRRTQKAEIAEMKARARDVHRKAFLERCPKEFDVILEAIDRWGFSSDPDYDGIYLVLTRVMQRQKIDFHDPYDWELESDAALRFDREHRAPLAAKDGGAPPSQSHVEQ